MRREEDGKMEAAAATAAAAATETQGKPTELTLPTLRTLNLAPGL